MTQERRTTFFAGTLLDPDDFSLEQDFLRGKSRSLGLSIREDGAFEEWAEVPSLAESGAGDRQYTLGARAWLALPIGTALAGLLAAFLRHRRA